MTNEFPRGAIRCPTQYTKALLERNKEATLWYVPYRDHSDYYNGKITGLHIRKANLEGTNKLKFANTLGNNVPGACWSLQEGMEPTYLFRNYWWAKAYWLSLHKGKGNGST